MRRFTEADIDELSLAVIEHEDALPSSYATDRRCYECEMVWPLSCAPDPGDWPDACTCGGGCEFLCIVPLSNREVVEGTPLEDFAEGGGVWNKPHQLSIPCED